MSTVSQRRHAMLIVDSVMNDIGLPHWLFNGAALGIYRDGELIEWDDDVDFCCKTESFMPKFDILCNRLKGLRFEINAKEQQQKLSAFLNGAKIAVSGYWLDKAKRYRRRKRFKIPSRMWIDYEYLDYHDRKLRVLRPIEEYLEWTYVNWRVVDKSFDERKYNRAEFLNY